VRRWRCASGEGHDVLGIELEDLVRQQQRLLTLGVAL